MSQSHHHSSSDRRGKLIASWPGWGDTPLGTRSGWSAPLHTLAETVDSSNRAMFLIWGEHHTLIYNRRFAELLGDLHPEWMGKRFEEVFSPLVDAGSVLERLDEGKPVELTGLRFAGGADGGDRGTTWRCSLTPVGGASAPTAALATDFERERRRGDGTEVVEVSAQQLSRLFRVEQRYRALFDGVDQGACFLEVLYDDEGHPVDHRFLEINSAYERLTGLTDAGGRRATEMVPDVDPHWNQLYDRVARERIPAQFTKEEPQLGRCFEVDAFPVDEPEKRRIGLLFRDVTAAKQRARNAELLAELQQDFSRLSAFENIIAVVAEKLGEFLDVGRVTFAEVDPDMVMVTKLYDHHRPGLPDLEGELRLRDFIGENQLELLGKGEPLVIDDVTKGDPGEVSAEAHAEYDARASLLVPHESEGRLKFLLGVHHDQPRRWRDEEVGLLCDLAPLLWYRLERARIEEALRATQGRLRRALEAADMIVWERDLSGAEFSTFPGPDDGGQLPYQGATQSLQKAESYIHPDDIDESRKVREEAIRNKSSYTTVHRIRRGEGDDWRWLEESGRLMEQPGEPDRLVGVARDITEQMRMRRRLDEVTEEAERRRRLHETIMATTPDLQYVFDLDYRIQYANPALLEMWGKSWDEAIGERLSNLGYERWHAQMHENEIDYIANTGKSVRGEVPFEGTKGRRIYDYLMVPVFDEEGNVEAVAGTTRDITERKKAEEALREADRRKDRFLSVLSHELRNPLAPIKLSLHLLERAEPGDERHQKALRVIERQTDQLTRLVDDLLDVTRITRDKIELQTEPLELNELAAEVVEDHQSVMEVHHTRLMFDPADEPVVVQGDRNRLAQVIGNLLHNAAKFTDKGGCVEVSVGLDAQSDQAVVRVVDDGIGMDSKMLQTLFEPFAQADEAVGDASGGLGLGLALVKGLVEMHGGQVQVRSEGPGEGTEFVIRLPAQREEQADLSPEKSERSTAVDSLRILLVEDNRDIADSLRRVLQLEGHRVEAVHDGESGVSKAEEQPFDVVICDIGLPDIDGYQVARTIRDCPAAGDPYLIALSGYTSEDVIEKARRAGFDRHLAKPPDIEEISELLAGVGQDG